MAKSIQLRFVKVETPEQITAYDSQLIILNGASGVHLDMEGVGNSVTILHSMTGQKFVSSQQDYFAGIWDEFIKQPAIGQVVKVRVNKLPLFGFILGDIEDAGDSNPTNPEDLTNAFAGMEEVYFMGSDAGYFVGKNQLTTP